MFHFIDKEISAKYKDEPFSVGEGEGGEIWENGIETYIISCMKRVASSRFNA